MSKRKIILDKSQSPGDILVFTTVVRDLKKQYPDIEIDVRSPCMAIFENNPYLKPLKKGDLGVEYYDVGYSDISNSGWSGRHFSNAYYIEIKNLLDIEVKQTSLLPDIHLSEKEKSWTNQIEGDFGYRGKFWLINAGHKGDYTLKQWGADNWQELIHLLRNEIQFVQVGEKRGDNHFHPKLKGVLDLVGKTNLRQLIRLGYHAEGSVCPVTFLMHLMAAYQKPCVVLAGGREPRRWESYPHFRYLDTNGLLDCCAFDGCWQSGRIEPQENKTCKNIVGSMIVDSKNAEAYPRSKCMQMIRPERVAEEIFNHYRGGILK